MKIHPKAIEMTRKKGEAREALRIPIPEFPSRAEEERLKKQKKKRKGLFIINLA